MILLRVGLVVASCVLLVQQVLAQSVQPSLQPSIPHLIQVIGIATSADGKTLPANDKSLYEEHHIVDVTGKRRTVSYRSNGAEFASKSVDYSADVIAPDFMQRDTRRGEVIAARRNPQGRIELGYQESADDTLRWRAVSASARPLVIDAGFDNFVQQQWVSLLQGKAISFDFAVPSRAQAVHLVIGATGFEHCGVPTAESSHCFRVHAGNYLIRLFFPPLYLLYDSERQLQRFIGLSNINDAQGDGQQVRIDYRQALPVGAVP